MAGYGLLINNNATTTLAGAINNTATTIAVASGTGALFPSPGSNQYFVATLVDALTGLVREIVWVTSRTGDTLTVVRGQEGTTPEAYLAGDAFASFVTAGMLETFQQSSHNVVPQKNLVFAVYIGPSYSNTITLNFTAPCNGYVFAYAYLNSSGPFGGTVHFTISNNITSDTATDTVPNGQSQVSIFPVSTGNATIITLTVQSAAGSYGNVECSYALSFFFVPTQ